MAADRGDYGYPVRAHHATHGRVLILDVYRVELEPHSGPAERLLEGMATISRADGSRAAISAPAPRIVNEAVRP